MYVCHVYFILKFHQTTMQFIIETVKYIKAAVRTVQKGRALTTGLVIVDTTCPSCSKSML